MDKKHILVVDDEQDIEELISYNLKKEGYKVTAAHDGDEALRYLKNMMFDLIILDLMLPGMQGTELCRIIRSDEKTRTMPIIMVTAKGEEVDRIIGLEMGADDYMAKPFSPRELIARVKAVLRRVNDKTVTAQRDTVGDLVIDRESYTVFKKGVAINLSATEFKLLVFLFDRRGKIFNRDQLLDAVWRDDTFIEPRTVDVHIRRLRTQIEADPSNPVYIKTRRGIGYYMEADL